MPYIDLTNIPAADRQIPPLVYDGVNYAHTSVQFASLALHAKSKKWGFPKTHLFALAIELGLKSLALRSGANLEECKKAGHNPEKMIELAERYGAQISADVKRQISSNEWFQAFLFMSRYPAFSELNTSLDKTIFLHDDYPKIIAEILSAKCRWPLSFEKGDAINEIRNPPDKMIAMFFRESTPAPAA